MRHFQARRSAWWYLQHQAVFTGTAIGKSGLYAPVSALTGRAITSIFGVPITCSARTVASGIVADQVVAALPEAFLAMSRWGIDRRG